MKYSICGMNAELNFDSGFQPEVLRTFISDFSGRAQVVIDIRKAEADISIEETELLLDDYYKWYRNFLGGTSVYVQEPDGSRLACKIEADNNWENVVITYIEDIRDIEDVIINHFCYMVFRISILYNQGLFIHASTFSWNSRGIIVTAPSGTGKSTHSSLWEKYYGAVVINDDSPAIRFIDGELMIYGNPWSGSSEKFVNTSVPLSAIVIIEQAGENTIRELDKDEAIRRILPRFILPFFDTELLSLASKFIDRIISDIPIYLLRCTPDRAAAELVYERLVHSANI